MINFEIDTNALILDQFQNDKQIYKFAPILIEKMYMLQFLTMIFFVGFFSQYVISVQVGKENLAISFVENIFILLILYLMRKCHIFLTQLSLYNRKISLVGKLFEINLALTIFQQGVNIQILDLVLTVKTDQTMMAVLLMFNLMLVNVLVSIQIKISVIVLIEAWLIAYSLTHREIDTLHELMLVQLHFQVLVNISQIMIQEFVVMRNYAEKGERVDLSFHTMHDLRNYIYSYIELNQGNSNENDVMSQRLIDNKKVSETKNIFENNKISESKISENSKYSENKKQRLSENIMKNSNMSVENAAKAFTEARDINEMQMRESVIMKSFNWERDQKISSNQNETIVMKDFDFEEMENFFHQKFILYKVCFLQHIELIFENMYSIKPTTIDTLQLMHKICESMKVLFMNKDNGIRVEMVSQVQVVELDYNIFEQLIVEMTKIFHDLGYENITFKFMFKKSDLQMIMNLSIEVDNLQIKNIHDINSKMSIGKLVQNLYPGIIQNQSWSKDTLNIFINFPYDFKRLREIQKQRKIKSNSKNSNINKNRSSRNEISQQNISKDNFQQSNNLDNLKVNESNKNIDQSVDVSGSNKSFSSTKSNGKVKQYEKIQVKIKKEKKTILDDLETATHLNEHLQNPKIILDDIIIEEKSEQEEDKDNKLSNNFSSVGSNAFQERKPSNQDSIKKNTETRKLSSKRESIINKVNSKSSKKLSKMDTLKIWLDTELESRETAEDKLPLPTQSEDGLMQINVDDEENILRMNKRVFSKEGIVLNGARTVSDFVSMLVSIQKNREDQKDSLPTPALLCVMDHMLDREWGYEAIARAQEVNEILKLDLTFVLLSSTEDKDTLDKYRALGVQITIAKPLNKGKLKPLLQTFKNDKQVSFQNIN